MWSDAKYAAQLKTWFSELLMKLKQGFTRICRVLPKCNGINQSFMWFSPKETNLVPAGRKRPTPDLGPAAADAGSGPYRGSSGQRCVFTLTVSTWATRQGRGAFFRLYVPPDPLSKIDGSLHRRRRQVVPEVLVVARIDGRRALPARSWADLETAAFEPCMLRSENCVQ